MTSKGLIDSLANLEKQLLVLSEGVAVLKQQIIDAIPKPPEPEDETDAEGNCVHPPSTREQAPTMGNAKAFVCGRCGKLIR